MSTILSPFKTTLILLARQVMVYRFHSPGFLTIFLAGSRQSKIAPQSCLVTGSLPNESRICTSMAVFNHFFILPVRIKTPLFDSSASLKSRSRTKSSYRSSVQISPPPFADKTPSETSQLPGSNIQLLKSSFRRDFHREVCIFAAVLLKNAILSQISGTDAFQLYSYSIEKTPLNPCRCNSFIIDSRSATPEPQGTSCAFLFPNSFKSPK